MVAAVSAAANLNYIEDDDDDNSIDDYGYADTAPSADNDFDDDYDDGSNNDEKSPYISFIAHNEVTKDEVRLSPPLSLIPPAA